ncbi:MAG: VTT domain-containing protein [Chloroflexota bacterium]
MEPTLMKLTGLKRETLLRWSLFLLLLAGLSVGMTYLLKLLEPYLKVPQDRYVWLPYLAVFGITLLANLTIVAPVPIANLIMIAAASQWNPFLIALAGSLGGAIGELSGYYAGYFGRKTVLPKSAQLDNLVSSWMRRYGTLAIFVLAFQPVIPFDFAGVVAGIWRLRLSRFLPAVWLGKFLKYLVLVLFGAGLIQYLPGLH